MKSCNHLISNLNPRYFWDVDFPSLNEISSGRLIIERVFSLGELHEMNQVIHFYGEKKVVEVLCNLPCLDPKTLNFITKLFHKPREEFRCYKQMLLKPQHWSL